MKDPDEYFVVVERGKNQTFWCELERNRTMVIRWEKEVLVQVVSIIFSTKIIIIIISRKSR